MPEARVETKTILRVVQINRNLRSAVVEDENGVRHTVRAGDVIEVAAKVTWTKNGIKEAIDVSTGIRRH